MTKKILILNHKQVQQKINRIAYQIFEDSYKEKELIYAGIASRGYVLAKKLANIHKSIDNKVKISLIELVLDKNKTLNLITDAKKINSLIRNKAVILIDDVLNTGSTLTYGLHYLLNSPTKKIRTVVLVDRSHKDFPIAADFVGLSLATTLHEHVNVVFDNKHGKNAVYLS